ncbi:MAG: hypothetical protein ABIB43_05985 [archaeon]
MPHRTTLKDVISMTIISSVVSGLYWPTLVPEIKEFAVNNPIWYTVGQVGGWGAFWLGYDAVVHAVMMPIEKYVAKKKHKEYLLDDDYGDSDIDDAREDAYK